MNCFEVISYQLSNELAMCKLHVDSVSMFGSNNYSNYAFASLEKIQVLRQMYERLINAGITWSEGEKSRYINRPPNLYEVSVIAHCTDMIRYEILHDSKIKDKPHYIMYLDNCNDDIIQLKITKEDLDLGSFDQRRHIETILGIIDYYMRDLEIELRDISSENALLALSVYMNSILELKKTDTDHLGLKVLINQEEIEVWV